MRECGYRSAIQRVKEPQPQEVEDWPDHKVVVISTGSQGEPMAALSRMANGDHRVVVGQGDTVILASSLIPGNENAVFRIINGLLKLGAEVGAGPVVVEAQARDVLGADDRQMHAGGEPHRLARREGGIEADQPAE